MRVLLSFLLCVLFSATAWASSPAQGSVTAIVGAKIVPMTAKKAFVGTVLLRGSVIIAVGKKVVIPKGAKVINGKGHWLTPGIALAGTSVGLVEVGLERSTRNGSMSSKKMLRAAFQVATSFNSQSTVVPVCRIDGITSVMIMPRGGLISGQSAWVNLSGLATTSLIQSSVALHSHVHSNWRGSSAHAWLHLRQMFSEARFLQKNLKRYEQGRLRRLRYSALHLKALFPVLAKKKPLVLQVNRVPEILAALQFARQQKIRVVLSEVAEGWKVAKALAKSRIPVLLRDPTNLPFGFDHLNNRQDNAALLYKAGVRFAFTGGGGAHHLRGIRHNIGIAVANGLPHAAALKALMSNVFSIFPKLGKRGRVKKGFIADLVLWSGDPLEVSTHVKGLWISGRSIPLVSRQTLLRDRYRKLPGR